ncbi:hypothetical protein H4R19_005974, partial [Coemansia spiralis]
AIAASLTADPVASEMVLSVADRVPARHVEDFGASLTLAALASYIGSLARAQWRVGRNAQHKYFDILVRALTTCRDAPAIAAEFTSFVDAYGVELDQHRLVEEYTRVERSGTSCESFVLALGALSDPGDLEVLCALVSGGAKPEIRRNAATAVGRFCVRADRLGAAQELAAVRALTLGLTDHAVDNRGDVGSWVREQCLRSLASVFEAGSLVLARLGAADNDLAMRLLGLVLRSTTEKIDKLRAAAGRLLELILGDGAAAEADPQLGECISQLARLAHTDLSDTRYVEWRWRAAGLARNDRPPRGASM